jgi:hypothetical protein
MPSQPSSPARRSRAGAAGSWSRNPRATFGPATAMNRRGAVAQQGLPGVRCRSADVYRAARQLGRFSTRRARTLRWISDEPP